MHFGKKRSGASIGCARCTQRGEQRARRCARLSLRKASSVIAPCLQVVRGLVLSLAAAIIAVADAVAACWQLIADPARVVDKLHLTSAVLSLFSVYLKAVTISYFAVMF